MVDATPESTMELTASTSAFSQHQAYFHGDWTSGTVAVVRWKVINPTQLPVTGMMVILSTFCLCVLT